MPLNRRFISSLLTGLIISSVPLAACGPGPLPSSTRLPISPPAVDHAGTLTPGASDAGATNTQAAPFSSGSIVIGGVGQPSREVTDLPRFVADALYDSLLEVDPTDGSLKPGLAASWQVSEDARAFTFHLRQGVQWNDGQPLTASDVVFTLKTLSARDVRIRPAADFGPIGEVEAPDTQTIVVHMGDAYCPALTSIGALKILPEHVLASQLSSTPDAGQQGGLTSLATAQFVGTGPLILQDWTPDVITFASNANYWNGSAGIAKWKFRIFPDSAAAIAALNSGQLDLLALDPGPDRGSISSPGMNIYSRPANEFYALAINHERDIFADPRMSQALAFALNRPKLTSDLYGGDAVPLQASILPGFWVTPSDAAQPTYDPARARQLLADAGWRDTDADGVLEKNGKRLTVTLWAVAGDPIDEPLAFSVRQMLSEVGIQPLLELDDRAELLSRLFSHEFDLALAPWNIPVDPDQHWYWQSSENKPGEGLNFTSYSNTHVDELLKRGNTAAACDPAARRGIYSEAFRSIAADVPEVFIFAPPVYLAAHSSLSGLEPSSFAGDYWNLSSWEMTP